MITEARPAAGALDSFLPAVLDAGVDVVQLREKSMGKGELAAVCSTVRRFTESFGAVFILNDFVDLAADCGADGVHLGQDDMAAEKARKTLGAGLAIGLSTHSRAEIDASAGSPVDYVGVGPVYATPTKPGRRPVGLELVQYAAAASQKPFFAIGGIDLGTVRSVIEAGATRIAVLRALTEAQDPPAVAAAIKRLLPSNS